MNSNANDVNSRNDMSHDTAGNERANDAAGTEPNVSAAGVDGGKLFDSPKPERHIYKPVFGLY